MNIIYQLLNGGRTDFEDIYAKAPWIEFLGYPGQTVQDVLDRVAVTSTNRRRAFKTHSAAPAVPFVHEGALRKIASFLGVEPKPDQWPAMLEYTSFPWVKQHEDRFEARTIGKVPVLKSGAMTRRGR